LLFLRELPGRGRFFRQDGISAIGLRGQLILRLRIGYKLDGSFSGISGDFSTYHKN
jgi:hypothetical protein